MSLTCEALTDAGEACARHEGHSGRHRPVPTLAEMFAFEGRDHKSSRWAAIVDEFQMPPIRYQQILNRVIDTREALELDPILTRRLQARRDQNSSRREHSNARA